MGKAWAKAHELHVAAGLVVIGSIAMAASVHRAAPDGLYPDLRMFLTGLVAAGVSVALQGRDTVREQASARVVWYLHVTAVLVSGLVPAATLLVCMTVWPGQFAVPSTVPLVWAVLFAAGLTALAAHVVRARTAAGITVLALAAVFISRYVMSGPTGARLALIHPESPPEIAWTVSVTVFVLGLAAVRMGKRTAIA